MLKFFLSLPVRTENVGFFVSPGHGIHPDRVISSHELILVRRGRLVMQEEKRRFEVEAGQVLLLWPGRRHRGVEDYLPDLAFYWIHFHLRSCHAGASFQLSQFSTPKYPDRLFEIFHRIMGEQDSGTFLQEEADLLLTLLLMEATRGSLPVSTSSSSAVGHAEVFISENFHRSIGAGDVARALQLNPDYLGRIFQRVHGHTLTEAIHRRRMREARSLLRETALNVEQVADASGFSDPRYFRRIFTRHQGISPRRYRQLHARLHINTR
jgi:AraC-like DNA-binding protein